MNNFTQALSNASICEKLEDRDLVRKEILSTLSGLKYWLYLLGL